MMKIMLLIFLSFGNCSPEKSTLNEVRGLYRDAAKDKKICQELIDLLAPYTKNENALLYGYRAGATMMMANHIFNPVLKLKYFNKGKKMLEKAIVTAPNNIELRLLRLQIQSNIPFFLGYNDQLLRDKNFILKNISGIKDMSLKKYIASSLESTEQ